MCGTIAALGAALGAVLLTGCGKKGPPLAPFVRLPIAPGEFTAARRGDTVDIELIVPASNTDNTRPANVERVDVYAFEGAPPVNEADFKKRSIKVATVDVKTPRDPDQTIEPDESAADIEPLVGRGLDQGSVARVRERLDATPARAAESGIAPDKSADVDDEESRPLLGVWMLPVRTRSYASQGINKRGRPGPLSRPAIVPLLPAPAMPETPKVTWDEQAVTVTWLPSASAGDMAVTVEGVLPSRPIAEPPQTLSYNVYEAAQESETRLTGTPVPDTSFSDPRMTWGAARCYTVRAVRTIDGLAVESDEPPPSCVTLTDTFAPAPPGRLAAVATEGAISLIWDPSGESDLEGYLVLRGDGSEDLKPITPAPIRETNFRDVVSPGVRRTYAVQAVDKFGNISPLSNRVEETAR